LSREWRHRTRVYKDEQGEWRWECRRCLTSNDTAGWDHPQAFRKAEVHTWVGGYTEYEDKQEG
jgi:hypothetical protein